MKHFEESIICAGFGGQGIMVLGKVLATVGMEAGLNVTWLPAYGAEIRGGTAHSFVRISPELIGSPVISQATTGIIMNEPSLEKFEGRIQKGGLLILNTSMVTAKLSRKDLEVVEAPLTEEAIKLGNVRVANMIAAGLYVEKKKIFSTEVLIRVIEKMARAAGHEKHIPINFKAVERGVSLAQAFLAKKSAR